MNRLDEAIASVAYILDCMMTYRNAIESSDCNSCKNKDCKWKPKPGQFVRYNCPHYKREGNPMDDYISRQAALDALGVTKNATKYGGDHSGYDTRMLYEIHDALTGIPAADVVPVVHAHWKDNKNGTVSCSRCSTWFQKERVPYLRFCGYCGAKMEE